MRMNGDNLPHASFGFERLINYVTGMATVVALFHFRALRAQRASKFNLSIASLDNACEPLGCCHTTQKITLKV